MSWSTDAGRSRNSHDKSSYLMGLAEPAKRPLIDGAFSFNILAKDEQVLSAFFSYAAKFDWIVQVAGRLDSSGLSQRFLYQS